MKRKSKIGQIWIETVIYTLIALIMIGAVLAFVRPKIQEIQDKLVIDQTFDTLEEIDSQITSVINGGVGNKRIINVEIKKGEIKIDPANENITFTLRESNSLYSEPGETIKIGKIETTTIETGKTSTVFLTLNYKAQYDIDYDTTTSPEILGKSPSPYKITITNQGGNKIEIEAKS